MRSVEFTDHSALASYGGVHSNHLGQNQVTHWLLYGRVGAVLNTFSVPFPTQHKSNTSDISSFCMLDDLQKPRSYI